MKVNNYNTQMKVNNMADKILIDKYHKIQKPHLIVHFQLNNGLEQIINRKLPM